MNVNENRKEIRREAFFYPIMVYYLVIAVLNLVLVPYLSEHSVDAVQQQALLSLAAGIALYLAFCARGENKRILTATVSRETGSGALLSVLMLSCAGIAVNNLIALTPLTEQSAGYQAVEQAFYSSGLGWEILALGLISPVVEELLYRGLVQERLQLAFGRTAAVLGSALIFGILHMNTVQALYSAVLGLLLALLMERYHDVRVPMLGHIAANLWALLRGETELFAWLERGEPLFYPVTLVCLVVTVYLAGYCLHGIRKMK